MIYLRHLIRVFAGITPALLLLLSGVALAGERKPAGELWADSLHAVAVNGTALAVLDVGAGEPVILLHGSSADYRTWCGEVEAMKARCRVIAYSRRYHHPNQGGGDGRDYSVALHERDLLGLMDALKLHNAHLVGYGTGGNIAAQFAVDHPDRVRSLVLAETAFPALMKDAPRARDYEDERRLVYEQAYQALASDFGELGFQAIANWEFGGEAATLIPRAVQRRLADNVHALKLQVLSPVRLPPLTLEQLRGIQCPVLCIDGARSPWQAKAMTDELIKCRPATQRVVLKNVSHGLVWDEPRGFSRAVTDFIDHPALAGE